MTAFTAFILANTRHGAMILNRFDVTQAQDLPGHSIGVGGEVLEFGEYQASEGNAIIQLMLMRRQSVGDGVIVLDIGANIGAHTCRWARACDGWGEVHAFEAQDRVFYALAGNIAIGNHFNAHAYHLAVGSRCGRLAIPSMNHRAYGNFGGLGLTPTDREPGQQISYVDGLQDVMIATIDSMQFPRVDLVKIDVEGMEIDVLNGAINTIMRCRPMIYAEHDIAGLEGIQNILLDYQFLHPMGQRNVLCIHKEDPALKFLKGVQ